MGNAQIPTLTLRDAHVTKLLECQPSSSRTVIRVIDTIVFDFIDHQVLVRESNGEVRPAPPELTVVITGATQPYEE